MRKRKLLTSVAASTVLAGMLMLSGCGGSNSPEVETLPNLGIGNPTAEGISNVLAEADGTANVKVSLISDTNKAQVAEGTLSKVLKNGEPACSQLSDGCKVVAKQVSACGIDASSAAFNEAKSHVVDLQNSSDRFDASTDMIVFGGTLDVSATGFDECSMSLAVNMIDCGSAFKADGTAAQAGFSNEDHVVDVFVKSGNVGTLSVGGTWIRNVRIKDGQILLTDEQIGSLSLPATFTFYSIKDSNIDGTTGVTGGTGGSGY